MFSPLVLLVLAVVSSSVSAGDVSFETTLEYDSPKGSTGEMFIKLRTGDLFSKFSDPILLNPTSTDLSPLSVHKTSQQLEGDKVHAAEFEWKGTGEVILALIEVTMNGKTVNFCPGTFFVRGRVTIPSGKTVTLRTCREF